MHTVNVGIWIWIPYGLSHLSLKYPQRHIFFLTWRGHTRWVSFRKFCLQISQRQVKFVFFQIVGKYRSSSCFLFFSKPVPVAGKFKDMDFQIIQQSNCVFFVIYSNIFFPRSLHTSIKSISHQDKFLWLVMWYRLKFSIDCGVKVLLFWVRPEVAFVSKLLSIFLCDFWAFGAVANWRL